MASFFSPLWRRILLVSAIGLSGPAMAQQPTIPNVVTGLDANGGQKTQAVGTGATGTFSVPMPVQGIPSGVPIPIIPGSLTYLGQQKFSAATLASTTALTLPTGATTANFFPECSVSGTDGVCIRFNPGGAADATTSGPMGASLQFYLGETGGLATLQVILAVGATGATGTSPTLTVNYYK